jgi:hypothetical protein
VSEPIRGWAPVDPDAAADPARRPISQVIGEVWTVYRRNAQPMLRLSILFEGLVALVSLPYIVLTIQLGLTMLGAFGRILVDPRRNVLATPEVAAAFDRVGQPPVAAFGGFVSVAPLASGFLLSGAAVILLATPIPVAGSANRVARTVLRRWVPLLIPVSILGIAVAIVDVWSYSLSAIQLRQPLLAVDRPDLGASLALSLLAPVIAIGGLYLAVRWAVAVPALVHEGIDLRAALARSSALTARRRLHVGLCLIVVGLVWSILQWVFLVPVFLVATLIVSAGGGPLLAVPLALFVAGRIVLAPILPTLSAILYRDLATVGPRPTGRATDGPEPPTGWGSPA